MALPRTLMRLVDPAEAYFEQRTSREPRRGKASYPDAAVLRPEGEVGGRPASEAELAVMRRRGAQRHEDHRAALAEAKQRWAAELRTAADELARERATRMPLGTWTVNARIITFWRGTGSWTSPPVAPGVVAARCRACAGTAPSLPTCSSTTWPERRSTPEGSERPPAGYCSRACRPEPPLLLAARPSQSPSGPGRSSVRTGCHMTLSSRIADRRVGVHCSTAGHAAGRDVLRS